MKWKHRIVIAIGTISITIGALLFSQNSASAEAKPNNQGQIMSKPFIEHPSGEFKTVILALKATIERLRALPHWDKWITLTAQGAGPDDDSYEFAKIRLLANKLDVGEKPLDLPSIIKIAKVSPSCIIADGKYYSLAAASSTESARILDAIFRNHFHIRPFEGEGNEYAFGAEW